MPVRPCRHVCILHLSPRSLSTLRPATSAGLTAEDSSITRTARRYDVRDLMALGYTSLVEVDSLASTAADDCTECTVAPTRRRLRQAPRVAGTPQHQDASTDLEGLGMVWAAPGRGTGRLQPQRGASTALSLLCSRAVQREGTTGGMAEEVACLLDGTTHAHGSGVPHWRARQSDAASMSAAVSSTARRAARVESCRAFDPPARRSRPGSLAAQRIVELAHSSAGASASSSFHCSKGRRPEAALEFVDMR
jgi:hypothetical protein